MGKFEVKKAKNGFMFNLIATNGEVIGTSQMYTAKSSALDGVESVRKTAPKAHMADETTGEKAVNPKFEIFNDKAGQFRFHLKASNGEIILASESYKAKADCTNGLKSVIKNAPNAKLVVM